MAGKQVMWQDAYVRQNGPTRFHVLLHIVDMEKPVYENQWLVKVGGQTFILWDHEVKSRFLFAAPVATEETAKPIQSEALKRFLEKNKESAKPSAEPIISDHNVSPHLSTEPTPVAAPIAVEDQKEHGEFTRDGKGEVTGVALKPAVAPNGGSDLAAQPTVATEDKTFVYPDYKPAIMEKAAEVSPDQSNGQEATT